MKDAEQKKKESFKRAYKDAKSGVAEAQAYLGICYENGFGCKRDLKKAEKYYLLATKQDFADATYRLCLLYIGNRKTFKISNDDILSLMIKASNLGSEEAGLDLGWMYYYGRFCMKDQTKAIDIFQELANKGNSVAQFNIGMKYYKCSVDENDYMKAFRWFECAAKQNDAAAINMLGVLYQNGQGVERSSQLAFENFKKASELNNVNAFYNLAECYSNGVGVRANKVESFKNYLIAAEKGFSKAYYRVGIAYLNGDGVDKNEEKAKQWLKKGCDAKDDYAISVYYRVFL